MTEMRTVLPSGRWPVIGIKPSETNDAVCAYAAGVNVWTECAEGVVRAPALRTRDGGYPKTFCLAATTIVTDSETSFNEEVTTSSRNAGPDIARSYA